MGRAFPGPPAVTGAAGGAPSCRHAPSSTAATSEYGTEASPDAQLVGQVDERRARREACVSRGRARGVDHGVLEQGLLALERPGPTRLDLAQAQAEIRERRRASQLLLEARVGAAAQSSRFTRPGRPKAACAAASGTNSTRAASWRGRSENSPSAAAGRVPATLSRSARPGSSRLPKSVLPGTCCAASLRSRSVAPSAGPELLRERGAHEGVARSERGRGLSVEGPEALVHAPDLDRGRAPARVRLAHHAPQREQGAVARLLEARRSASDSSKG